MTFLSAADSEPFIRAAHILSGALAVVCGALALLARKGSAFHGRAGRVFAGSMILSALLGAVAGALDHQAFYITIHAGILAMTLILTSWLVIVARSGAVPMLFGATIGLSGLNTLGLLWAVVYAAQQPDAVLFGFSAADYAFLAALAGVALIGELRIFLRGYLSPQHRLAAHLWRMCCAFFIAAGSAFTGPGEEVFPDVIRGSGVLSLPEAAIVCAMLYWLLRVWRGRFRLARKEPN